MRKYIAVFIAACIMLGLGAFPALASNFKKWRYIGNVQGYTSSEDMRFDFDQLEWTLEEYRAKIDGMRLFKSVGSTIPEVKHLKAFVRSTAKSSSPTMWCRTGYGSGYFIDLAYHYVASIHKLNSAEKIRWSKWVRGYAGRHHCKVYR